MNVQRYASFGERVGAVPALTLPLDKITQAFRNAIWNLLGPLFREHDSYRGIRDVYPSSFVLLMAEDKHWLKDEFRSLNNDGASRFLREWIITEATWHEVYEFLESFPRWAKFKPAAAEQWTNGINAFLAEEQSPYRFVNQKLAPITSEEEQAEVARASSKKGKYDIAADHLGKALVKFSMRPNPDYENACKEAASAVEASLNIANGTSSAVGDAVKNFAKTHSVHPALMDSANKLFGYASDRDGVRHANKGQSNPVDFDEAKLVIVSASVWVNFVAAKAP